MRPYYEDPCGCPPRHHHGRPNIEIDVVPNWGGAYYPPATPARTEVVYVTPGGGGSYMPAQVAGPQLMMPQPYGGMTMGSAGYYQQQQGYEYQYQQQQYQQHNPYPQYQQW
ncbi:uncharacterized protein LOC117900403 [Drosophila subobscura]|uniref:uncharacterized protein LOC117900403 n=1 Tax=Drosophila subobscura TaxID=7241 RepID=UPI00155B2146|nr:uncharacterized protein LOC117900403 [Drosophila subobscura]